MNHDVRTLSLWTITLRVRKINNTFRYAFSIYSRAVTAEAHQLVQ